MARSIISIMTPRVIRGALFFQVVDVLFASRAAGLCAASALLEQQRAQGGGQ